MQDSKLKSNFCLAKIKNSIMSHIFLESLSDLFVFSCINPLSANPTKWPNTLKQFVGNLPNNFLSVFDHFVGLALKGLGINTMVIQLSYPYWSSPSN